MEKLDEEPHGVPRRAKENREFYRTTITSSFLVFYLLKRQWYAFFKGLFKLCHTAVMQKIMPSSL